MGFNSPRNKKMIRLLAINTLKANGLRFIISGIAIVLTALLITGVFTMGLSLYETNRLVELYKNGGRFHGAIMDISANDMKKLANSGEFVEYGYISALSEYPVNGLPLDLVSGSENIPDLTLTKITGHMPRKYNEVSMSAAALDRFGVSHKLDETVTITYKIGEVEKTEEFSVCGFWKDNPDGSLMGSRVFVSEEFANQSSFDGDSKSGAVSTMLFVNLDKPQNVYNRLAEIIEKAGVDALCRANPVYDEYMDGTSYTTSNIITDTLLPFIILLIVIMISAYLLIYNIFYISVTRDIRFYGLIKAIGATNKQIRRIIRIQAVLLSIVSIPVGLILGYAVSLFIVPTVLSVNSFSLYTISSSPLIFIFAAVFSLITVLLSASRPGAFAGRVSPIEAVRHTGILTDVKQKEKKTAYGAKLHIMAFRNVFRGKKKLILSVISLSAGITLFCLASSLTSSFSLELYLKTRMYGDFRISKADFTVNDGYAMGEVPTLTDGDALTPEFIDEIRRINGVESVEEIYYVELEDAALDKVLMGYEYDDANQLKEIIGNVIVEVFGISGGWVDKLKEFIAAGEFDESRFLSGDYAIISRSLKTNVDSDGKTAAEAISYYTPGDKINVEGLDGGLTVMAVTNNISFGLTGERYGYTNAYELYLPADKVKVLDGAYIMSAAVFATDSELTSVKNGIMALLSDKQGLVLALKEIYIQEFSYLVGAMSAIALGLSILLCIIGMTNFINTSATSIIARHYELSVLEGIGMAKAQLKRMIMIECLIMGGISLLVSAALSYPLSSWMVGSLVRENGFMEFTYSWMPLFIWLVFIGFASVLTSLASYRSISRGSLSSRLISN